MTERVFVVSFDETVEVHQQFIHRVPERMLDGQTAMDVYDAVYDMLADEGIPREAISNLLITDGANGSKI